MFAAKLVDFSTSLCRFCDWIPEWLCGETTANSKQQTTDSRHWTVVTTMTSSWLIDWSSSCPVQTFCLIPSARLTNLSRTKANMSDRILNKVRIKTAESKHETHVYLLPSVLRKPEFQETTIIPRNNYNSNPLYYIINDFCCYNMDFPHEN